MVAVTFLHVWLLMFGVLATGLGAMELLGRLIEKNSPKSA